MHPLCTLHHPRAPCIIFRPCTIFTTEPATSGTFTFTAGNISTPANYPAGLGNKVCGSSAVQITADRSFPAFSTGKILRNRVGESKIVDGICRATEDVITLKSTPEEAMAAFAAAMKDSLGEDKIKQA
jgi:hypothetical protein